MSSLSEGLRVAVPVPVWAFMVDLMRCMVAEGEWWWYWFLHDTGDFCRG